jgi:hypothetical protein
MQPRIYTYKITFEEIPHWYWGIHKEKRFGELYLGSPVTHKWMWEFYTPKIQILEFFPNTEDGWREACEVEKRIILPDLNNPFCLNENCGGNSSLETQRRASALAHVEKDEQGKSINAVVNAKKCHENKNEEGKSINALRMVERVHSIKNEEGKSVHAVNVGKKSHRIKNEEGKSILAIRMVEKVHSKKNSEGKSINAINAAKKLHSSLNEEGKSIAAVFMGRSGGTMVAAQRWVDPDHPELGAKSAGTLTRMQKSRGYPHGKENRVRIK